MACTAEAAGVSCVGVTGDGMDALEVVGSGVDAVCLVKALRKKVGHACIMKVEQVKAIEDAQPAYEPANVRRRSGIQSTIISKLNKFMWWSHDDDDDIGGTSLSPPLRIDPLPAASGVPSSHDVVTVSETAPPTTEEELELLHDDHHAVDALQEHVAPGCTSTTKMAAS